MPQRMNTTNATNAIVSPHRTQPMIVAVFIGLLLLALAGCAGADRFEPPQTGMAVPLRLPRPLHHPQQHRANQRERHPHRNGRGEARASGDTFRIQAAQVALGLLDVAGAVGHPATV